MNRAKYRNILEQRIDRPSNLAQVNPEKNEILIYEEIGFWGVTAGDFSEALKATDPNERLTVGLNSPGGDIFDGVAIMNTLVGRGNVEIRIDGFAASIASIIAMAGDRILMAENAAFMIHNPWTVVGGDAESLRKEAEVLDKLKTTLIKSYQRHVTTTESELSRLMDEETWFTADEAKDVGFVTEIINSVESSSIAQNRFDLSLYRNVPETFRKKQRQSKTNSGGEDAESLRRYHFQLRHRTNMARSRTYED